MDDKQQKAADEPATSPRARARDKDSSTLQLSRTARRLDEAEEMLLTEVNERKGMGILAARWGVSRSQVKRYMVAVKDRLAEVGRVDREEKIANLRARLRRYQRIAMEREKGYVVQDSEDSQTVEMVPDPDVRAAVNAAELEARVDGLFQQTVLPGGSGFEGDALGRMQAFLFGAQVAQAIQGQQPEPALPAVVTVVEKGSDGKGV